MFQLTPIVKKILLINAAVLFVAFLLSVDLAPLFGVHYILSEHFYVFQYVTYMWLHAGLWHLFSNMLAIMVFGPMLEQVWGSKRFLTFYLITGIGAGVLYGVVDTIEKRNLYSDYESFVANPDPDEFYMYVHEYSSGRYNLSGIGTFADEYYDHAHDPSYTKEAVHIVKTIYNDLANIPMVGASGAVFGVLLAFAMLFPNTELLLLFPPIPIKAKYLVFFYGLYELYSEFNRSGGDNVAHFAHLSGMLIAFFVLKYWQKQRGSFY